VRVPGRAKFDQGSARHGNLIAARLPQEARLVRS
jgi:hypothetical protein